MILGELCPERPLSSALVFRDAWQRQWYRAVKEVTTYRHVLDRCDDDWTLHVEYHFFAVGE